MIEINSEMSQAELVAYFTAARQRINDLLVKINAREAANSQSRIISASADKVSLVKF
jgi:hypothetical protein